MLYGNPLSQPLNKNVREGGRDRGREERMMEGEREDTPACVIAIVLCVHVSSCFFFADNDQKVQASLVTAGFVYVLL